MRIQRALAAALAALALAAADARAEGALVSFQPEPDFELLVGKSVQNFKPADALAFPDSCRIVDAKTIRAYSLDEALLALRPCLSDLSRRYGLSVTAGAGIVEVAKDGRAGTGIVLWAPKSAVVGSSVLRDVNHSLAARGDRLLGHRACLRREGESAPQARSAAQDALGRCPVPMVLYKIRTAADFLKRYGGCLLRDSVIQARTATPLRADPRAFELASSADAAVVASLDGTVTVMAEDGPATFLVLGSAQKPPKP